VIPRAVANFEWFDYDARQNTAECPPFPCVHARSTRLDLLRMRLPESLCALQLAASRSKAGINASTEQCICKGGRRYVGQQELIMLKPTAFTFEAMMSLSVLQSTNTRTTQLNSRETTSSSTTPGIWDPDEYMQSYDSDDYDEATYLQLQSKRGIPQYEEPRVLFETAADRRNRKSKESRKVSV